MKRECMGTKGSSILVGCFFAGLLALAGAPAPARDPRGVGALAPLSTGKLVLLEQGGGLSQGGGLFLVDPPTKTMRRLETKPFAPFSAADVAVHPMERGEDRIFVTMRSTSHPSVVRRRLACFTLSGENKGEWLSMGGLSVWTGVAIKPDGKTAYIATSRREVHKVDIGTPGKGSELLAGVRGAETLGPIVFDAKRGRLLVADPIQGLIFAVQLDRSGSSILVRRVGEPYALALDTAADRLFIADAEGGQILAVSLAEPAPQVRLFARIDSMEQPHGLAVGRDGTLWVGGYGTLTLYKLSASGSLLGSFRPKLVEPPVRR